MVPVEGIGAESAGRVGHWSDATRAAHALKYLGEMLNSRRNASC